MAELDTILQPAEYRREDAPEWVFVPSLRLLLGWGEGLWETLGDRMTAVRTLCLVWNPGGAALEELRAFFRWIDRYDADRPPMPFYARILDDASCQALHANDVCKAFVGPSAHALNDRACGHPIEANEEYRVTHEVSEDRLLQLFVEKRTKSLKAEFRAKMEGFGLEPVRGTGRRSERKPADEKRVRRLRNESEQAFAKHLDGLKQGYHAKRLLQLLEAPAARPPRFLVRMAELERSRLEAVARGKHDNDGMPYRAYRADELVAATCHSIASSEATEIAFDYEWRRLLRFDRRGLTAL